MSIETLKSALQNANVRAFLMVIRSGEGTAGENGYRMMFGGGLFDSYDDHPRRPITKPLGGKPITSTAAGAYQFLATTWGEMRDRYKLSDFSPESQDIAAAGLILRRKALHDVQAGRFDEAIGKCNKEWASLPGSPYGQPVMTMARARRIYELHGGTYAVPVVEHSVESSVSPFLPAALEAVVKYVPDLLGIFSDKGKASAEKNVSAAVKVVEAAKQAIGASNEQELVEKLQSDPSAASSVTTAVRGIWFDLVPADGGGIAGAAERAKMGKGNPAFIVTCLLLPLIYGVVGAVIFMDGWDSNIRSFVVGVVVGSTLGAIVAFWLGSSFGSSKKDDVLMSKTA